MDGREEILTINFQEYYDFGIVAFKSNKYNSATTLFFKAIVALLDLYILRKTGVIPSSE